MTDLFLRYAHFFSIILLAGFLMAENALFKKTLTRPLLRQLVKLDAVYGFSAVAVVLSGLGVSIWGAKPLLFYTLNSLFLIKVGLFVLVGLISVVPTLFLIKNRNCTAAALTVPVYVRVVKRIELVLLLLFPLLAVFVAKGVGI